MIRKGTGLLGASAIAALVAFSTGGCSSEDSLTGECSADVTASAEALGTASDALVSVAGKLRADVYLACATIADDLGAMDAPDPNKADPSDDDVKTACNSASAVLDARVSAAGSVSIAIEGGRCEVNASAQFSCEANCSVEGECDPGTLEARCDPGELSVQCEGECSAGASCQGSATVAANCEGSCEGSCTGTCEGVCNGTCNGTCETMDGDGNCAGTCMGECQGTCSAKCTGTCSGECTLAADANIECGAEARCKGGCSGTATAPSCEATLEPPSCELDAECQAGCEGQANLQAECTPPTVKVIASGDAELVATLEANLPLLINAAEVQGKLALEAATAVGDAAVTVTGEIAGKASCVASLGASIVAKLEAAASASASVSVSVNASASASGSAQGGS